LRRFTYSQNVVSLIAKDGSGTKPLRSLKPSPSPAILIASPNAASAASFATKVQRFRYVFNHRLRHCPHQRTPGLLRASGFDAVLDKGCDGRSAVRQNGKLGAPEVNRRQAI
jgi:hypothetical protein